VRCLASRRGSGPSRDRSPRSTSCPRRCRGEAGVVRATPVGDGGGHRAGPQGQHDEKGDEWTEVGTQTGPGHDSPQCQRDGPGRPCLAGRVIASRVRWEGCPSDSAAHKCQPAQPAIPLTHQNGLGSLDRGGAGSGARLAAGTLSDRPTRSEPHGQRPAFGPPGPHATGVHQDGDSRVRVQAGGTQSVPGDDPCGQGLRTLRVATQTAPGFPMRRSFIRR